MDHVRIIEVKQSVFADNDKRAAQLRQELKGRGVFLLNLMSSPRLGQDHHPAADGGAVEG